MTGCDWWWRNTPPPRANKSTSLGHSGNKTLPTLRMIQKCPGFGERATCTPLLLRIRFTWRPNGGCLSCVAATHRDLRRRSRPSSSERSPNKQKQNKKTLTCVLCVFQTRYLRRFLAKIISKIPLRKTCYEDRGKKYIYSQVSFPYADHCACVSVFIPFPSQFVKLLWVCWFPYFLTKKAVRPCRVFFFLLLCFALSLGCLQVFYQATKKNFCKINVSRLRYSTWNPQDAATEAQTLNSSRMGHSPSLR